jgi:hypothetical protein
LEIRRQRAPVWVSVTAQQEAQLATAQEEAQLALAEFAPLRGGKLRHPWERA